jgi:hypothetical protein
MRFSAGTSCSSSPTRGGLTGDRQAALDVVQKSFIRAADHLVRLREDDKFGSSIFGIAHQRCVLHIRRAAGPANCSTMKARATKSMPPGWRKMNIVRFFDLHVGGGDPSWFEPDSGRIDLGTIERSDALQDNLRHSWSPFDWLIRQEASGTKITVYAALGQSRLGMARSACALERYRLAHGEYPAELSALVPTFLERVLRDVVDHAPLRYERPQEDGFRLYSLGLSGIDARAWPGRPDLSSCASPEGYWVWSETDGYRTPNR